MQSARKTPQSRRCARGVDASPERDAGPARERGGPGLRAGVHLPERGHRRRREADPQDCQRRDDGMARRDAAREHRDRREEGEVAERLHDDHRRRAQRDGIAHRGDGDLHRAEHAGLAPGVGDGVGQRHVDPRAAHELEVVVAAHEPRDRGPQAEEGGEERGGGPGEAGRHGPGARGCVRRLRSVGGGRRVGRGHRGAMLATRGGALR